MNQFRLIILLSLVGISGIAADKKAKAYRLYESIGINRNQ